MFEIFFFYIFGTIKYTNVKFFIKDVYDNKGKHKVTKILKRLENEL